MVLGYKYSLKKYTSFDTDTDSVLLLGKPKTGKTTTLNRLVLDEIHNGQPVVFIGQSDEVLSKIPKDRQEDVIYFSPSESPFAFNILNSIPDRLHPLFAGTILETVKGVWGYETPTPTLDMYIRVGIQTLLSVPGSSLVSLKFLLTDELYRADVIEKLKDKLLKEFWRDYRKLTPKEQRQDTSSTLNKVWAFLFEPLVRNCIDQKDNKLEFEDKIVLINLDESLLGNENARLLGALILAKLYVDGQQGVNTSVFVDDSYRYGSTILGMLLASPLRTVITAQYLSQFSRLVLPSILSGVDLIMAFRLSLRDSDTLKPEFFLKNDQDLYTSSVGEAYVMRDLKSELILSFPNQYKQTKQANKIKKRCVSQYTQPVKKIERRLGRFFT